MSKIKILDGNHAIAEAMRQIDPDVVAAYPITPTSYVMEGFSKFVADGKVNTELVTVESEHSAMSACIGASAAGGRVMTATASQGLALMNEVLFSASGLNLPIVLVNGNRALSSPLNIHCDHSDSMAARDCGWIQFYAQTPQEGYDLTIQAIKISEDINVRTPVMINIDGFQNTHTMKKIQIEDDRKIKKFIGEYIPLNPLFDIKNPVSYGAADKPDYYFEHRRVQLASIENSLKVIKKTGREFKKKFGRDYSKYFESYKTKDAKAVIVVLGSNAGTVRHTVDTLRKKNKKVGMLRLRLFRPFPAKEIANALKKVPYIGVFDRTSPSGALGGPVYNEVRSAFYGLNKKPTILNYIYGLGGRELYPKHIEVVFEELLKGKVRDDIRFLNLRE